MSTSNEVAKGILKAYGTLIIIALCFTIALCCCALLLFMAILPTLSVTTRTITIP